MKVTIQKSPDEGSYFSPSCPFEVGVPYDYYGTGHVVVSFSAVPKSTFGEEVEQTQKPAVWLPTCILESHNLKTGHRVSLKKVKNFVTCSFLVGIIMHEHEVNAEFINDQHQVCSIRNECINKVSIPNFCDGDGMYFCQDIDVNGEKINVRVYILPMANALSNRGDVYCRRSWVDPNNTTDIYHIRYHYREDIPERSSNYKSPFDFWKESGKYSLFGFGWRKSDNLQAEVREFLGIDPGFVFRNDPESYISQKVQPWLQHVWTPN